MMKMNLMNLTTSWFPQIVWEEPDAAGTSPASAVTGGGEDTAAASTGEDTAAATTGDDTAAASTGDDTAASSQAEPEPITMESLTLPEGFEIPEEQQGALLEVLNDPEVSRADLVNRLIEMQTNVSTANVEALQQAMNEQWLGTQTEWQKQLSAVPEFGGERLDESLAEVKKGLEAAGATKEVFDALDVTGAGNHPALVPLLHKLIKPFLEGAPVATSPSSGKLSREAKMFPNMVDKG